MAVLCKVGRPYQVADIDMAEDPILPWYDDFCDACASITYRDMMVASRTLGISWRTIYRWKEGITFPARIELAQMLIRWVKAGKPLKSVTQVEAATGVI